MPAPARLDTVGRRRRRRAASAVGAAGLHVRPWRAVNCRSAAIGAVRPIGLVWSIWSIRPVRAIWPARPVGPVGAIRPIRSVGAPGSVRPPRPVGSVVAVAPVVVAPGAVAIIVRIAACAERRGAKKKRQRASKPGHVCDVLLSVKPSVVCTACIAPALRIPVRSCPTHRTGKMLTTPRRLVRAQRLRRRSA